MIELVTPKYSHDQFKGSASLDIFNPNRRNTSIKDSKISQYLYKVSS